MFIVTIIFYSDTSTTFSMKVLYISMPKTLFDEIEELERSMSSNDVAVGEGGSVDRHERNAEAEEEEEEEEELKKTVSLIEVAG